MRAQITLTVNGAKRLIAKGVTALPEVRQALENGKILLKAGTTVSALAEELGFAPLRISGRMTPLGAKGSAIGPRDTPATHTLLIERGVARDVYWELDQTVAGLGPDDVVVIGANAIDAYGGAAVMAGTPLGGPPGFVWAGMQAQGAQIIVAAGLEKLIPGRIGDAVLAAGRARPDLSMGMAVGLMPIFGRVFTEVEACLALGAEKATAISCGGVDGAEGAATLVIEGEAARVREVVNLALRANRSVASGLPASLQVCRPGRSPSCPDHESCLYFHPERLRA